MSSQGCFVPTVAASCRCHGSVLTVSHANTEALLHADMITFLCHFSLCFQFPRCRYSGIMCSFHVGTLVSSSYHKSSISKKEVITFSSPRAQKRWKRLLKHNIGRLAAIATFIIRCSRFQNKYTILSKSWWELSDLDKAALWRLKLRFLCCLSFCRIPQGHNWRSDKVKS